MSGHWSRMHFVTRMWGQVDEFCLVIGQGCILSQGWGHVDEFYLVIGQGCILSQGCRDK